MTKPIVDDGFISGKPIYNRRDPSEPYVLAHFQQFKHGFAWSLGQPGQYVAITILGIHIILALVHTAVLIRKKRSSAAWDSISELIILAYRSAARPGAFENCSSGVEFSETVGKRVRVGTRVQDNGDEQAELVICQDENGAGNIVTGKEYS